MIINEYYETARPFYQNKAPVGMMYKIYTITIQSLSGAGGSGGIDNEFGLYADYMSNQLEAITVKGQPTHNNLIAPFTFQTDTQAFFDFSNSPIKTKYLTGLFGSTSPACTCIVTISCDLVPYDKATMTIDALVRERKA